MLGEREVAVAVLILWSRPSCDLNSHAASRQWGHSSLGRVVPAVAGSCAQSPTAPLLVRAGDGT